MTLTPKASLTTSISLKNHHIEEHFLKKTTITSVTGNPVTAAAAAVAVAQQPHNISNLQHIQSLNTQHSNHHLFYNNSHSTPFSVTDILSPGDEPYRKLENHGSPSSPFR